jgi:hypothetical protein
MKVSLFSKHIFSWKKKQTARQILHEEIRASFLQNGVRMLNFGWKITVHTDFVASEISLYFGT